MRICLINALLCFVLQMLVSAFPVYLGQRHFSSSQIGFIAGGYTACELLSRLASGRLVDTVGRRAVGLAGIGAFLLAMLGYRLAPFLGVVVVLRVLQGLGSSAMTNSIGATATDALPKERFAEGLGYFGMFSTVPTSVGPAVGIALISRGRESVLFGGAAVFLALALILYVTVPDAPEVRARRAPMARRSPGPEESGVLWRFLEKTAMPSAAVTFLLSAAVAAQVHYISPYGLGLGLSGVSAFFLIDGAMVLLVRLFYSRRLSWVGYRKSLLLGLSLVLLSYVLLTFLSSRAMLYLAGVPYGLGTGVCYLTLNVLAVEKAPAQARGRAMSTFYSVRDIGVGLGAVAWGAVIDWMGYEWIFALSALLLALALALGWRLFSAPGEAPIQTTQA